MRIGINGSFLRKPYTGIGQVSTNFVKELTKLAISNFQSSIFKHKEVEFFLYLEQDIKLKLPHNFHKRIFLPKFWRRDDLIRKVWWEKFLLPKMVQRDQCEMFLSLYQCPTVLPAKIRHKMLVHDLIPQIFPEYLDNWRKKFYYFLTQKAIRRADEILTVSEWSKKDICKFLKIPDQKVKVAYPSIGEEFFKKNSPEKDYKILEKYGIFGRYILYIGGLDFRKNVSGLIEAFAKLLKRYEFEDVKLILGGEDNSSFSPLFTDVKKEIEKFGLGDKAKLIGLVERADLPALYRNCELCVIPSFYEGFGLMVLEAMASGAPTAVSKTSALPEVGGEAVLYFNPYDADEIARVMGKILRNNKLRLRLAEKGKKRAKKFEWKSFMEKFLE